MAVRTRKSSGGWGTQRNTSFAGKAGTAPNVKPRYTRKSSGGYGTQLGLGFGGRGEVAPPPPPPPPTPSPITVIPRGTIADGTNTDIYLTGVFVSSASELLVACYSVVRTGSQPSTPIVSGHAGLVPWTQIATVYYETDAGTRRSIFLFACITGIAPISEPVLFSHGGQTHGGAAASVFEITNADEAHGLLQTFVQAPLGPVDPLGTVNTIQISLAAPANQANRPFAFFVTEGLDNIVQRTNWTEIHDVNYSPPESNLASQWRQDDFEGTASASWATIVGVRSGIAWEIKVAVEDILLDRRIGGGVAPKRKRENPDIQQANLVIMVTSQYRLL